ncbi:MBL fold metallo-hydrolase [Sphingomonas histidinilytica]|jgi:phosphoribosyl 1,2-cyclic phosphodiesterase|uniref:Phosphoribosyl 1,2-cyclic phosphodiesterase n=1 Tax=Rhizorhabdus histidinilytica TaxID=439228 RepID=A0A1T5BXY5_9SPHN|nr:MBL fold metallo-hydrolase [Rhizorhabdus histidinilytica]MBO9375200.1 MBL fold metallo-hydrolase [Rhizorhabdus histidinilytica]QEH77420.1 MBL fold metallo-hydrolase [Sphingomonas sp. C8-2]SKB52218.1 Phosphoribosyl 1,2-cyclic phosphodiesterase [Rhizorhabdus histidinilytica]
MLVRFWGTRGSLAVAQTAGAIRGKIARALVAAGGRGFADTAEAEAFVDRELDFATGGTYGGATTCVEIEGGDGSFIVCDMGTGLREFGIDAFRRCAAGHERTYHFFMSHLHWDHIGGFPFFGPAFDPNAHIVIHSGHADAEQALRRQQEEISFPVAFDWLRAKIEFRTLAPGETYRIGGLDVEVMEQHHSHKSYGYRFTDDAGKTAIFSTDSEHKIDSMEGEADVAHFFRDADLVICDTMYSLADAVSMKEDWGHSSNIVAIDLCHEAEAKRLALFHHEPIYSDDDIQRMHQESIRYEELTRRETPLEVLCAYDGLEVRL